MALNKIDIQYAVSSGMDDEVLSYLYKNTLNKVRSYVIKNSGTPEEADDIFQDAVISLYQQVKKGAEIKNISAFVFMASRNNWINRAKRIQRQTTLDKEEEIEGTMQNGLEDILSEERKKYVELVFGQLGEKCKDLLSYSIYQKLTMEEIAKIMGWAGADVAKTKNYKCKKRLMEIVQNSPLLKDLFRS